MNAKASLLILLTAASSFAQGVQSTPQQTSGSGTTLYTSANLVVLDVVVTDRKGAPVHHLGRGDFSILEGNKAQTVKTFEEHESLSEAETKKVAPMPPMPPGVFTNFSPAPAGAAVNILLFDALNTPLDDQTYARAQLVDYIEHAPPSTSTAVLGLTAQLHMLQGFTSDPSVLRQAILKKAGRSSPLLGGAGSNEPFSQSVPGSTGGVQGAAEAMQAIDNLQQISGTFSLALRAKYTLDAMNLLARYLSNVPGRKNLVWFSGSFPLALQPDSSIEAPDPYAGTTFEDEYRETVDLLTRGRVAVYPVDARGLMVDPIFKVEREGPERGMSGSSQLRTGANFSAQLAAEHTTMQRMARDTGGRAYYNGNNLSKATQDAIDNGSSFYTLSYTPTESKLDGTFRKVQVKVAESGYTASYRHGYYALRAGMPPSPNKTAPAAKDAPEPTAVSAVHNAMVHGVPGPTEILFKVRALPVKGIDDTVAELNQVTALGKQEARGKFRRYVVDFDVAAETVTFTKEVDGMLQAKVEFAGLVYQPDGALSDAVSSTLTATVTAAQHDNLVHSGLPFRLAISVPDRGEHSLRIGVRDLNSQRLGALEFQVAAVAELPPVDPPTLPLQRRGPAPKLPDVKP